MQKFRRFEWVAVLAGVAGCTTILGVDLDYHSLDGGSSACPAPALGDGGLSCADAGPGTGQIRATIVANVGADRGALMAIADGTPDTDVAGDAPLWMVEKAKTWYGVSVDLPFSSPTPETYAACVPAGSYTLQLWDRFGVGGTSDNGIPPNNTYPWEIGNASRTLVVPAGGVVSVTVTDTITNVPDGGAFYGSWTLWDYGPCATDCDCPAGVTCQGGACYDLGYDIRNCGSVGHACAAAVCCAGACVSIDTDGANCGTCGLSCPAGKTCTSGQCQ